MAVFTAVFAHAKEVKPWATLPEAPPMPAAAKSGYAAVNGISLYYAVYGQGEPIIFLHGGASNADVWSRQVASLSPKNTVIVMDSRGHGRSTRSKEPLSYALMASDVIALMDTLKIEKAAIAGWSDGAIIGLLLAMTRPERITRVFAHAANTTLSGLKPGGAKRGMFPKYMQRARTEYQRLSPTPTEYDEFTAALSRMWKTEPNWTPAQLRRITAPAVVAVGDHDEVIDLKHSRQIAASIKGARFILLEGTSHFSMLQKPEDYAREIDRFINSEAETRKVPVTLQAPAPPWAASQTDAGHVTGTPSVTEPQTALPSAIPK